MCLSISNDSYLLSSAYNEFGSGITSFGSGYSEALSGPDISSNISSRCCASICGNVAAGGSYCN